MKLGSAQRRLLSYAAAGELRLVHGWGGAYAVSVPWTDERRYREEQVERLTDLGLLEYENPGEQVIRVVVTGAGWAALRRTP